LVRFPSILDQPDSRDLSTPQGVLSSDLRVNSNIDMRGHHLVGQVGGAYTPTWTALTANPAIGNGTISGRWSRNGNLVTYWGKIVMGSTTTYGTGLWYVSLPVPSTTSWDALGTCLMYDVGTDILTTSCRIDASISLLYFPSDSYANVGTGVPWSWANQDELQWQITYEVAA
jgi:hypothetical protein